MKSLINDSTCFDASQMSEHYAQRKKVSDHAVSLSCLCRSYRRSSGNLTNMQQLIESEYQKKYSSISRNRHSSWINEIPESPKPKRFQPENQPKFKIIKVKRVQPTQPSLKNLGIKPYKSLKPMSLQDQINLLSVQVQMQSSLIIKLQSQVDSMKGVHVPLRFQKQFIDHRKIN